MLQRRKGRTTGARSGTFRKPAYGGVSKSRQRTAQYLRYSHSDGSGTCQLDRKKKARARIAREEGRGNASRSARHKGFQAERTGIDLLARAFGRRRRRKTMGSENTASRSWRSLHSTLWARTRPMIGEWCVPRLSNGQGSTDARKAPVRPKATMDLPFWTHAAGTPRGGKKGQCVCRLPEKGDFQEKRTGGESFYGRARWIPQNGSPSRRGRRRGAPGGGGYTQTSWGFRLPYVLSFSSSLLSFTCTHSLVFVRVCERPDEERRVRATQLQPSLPTGGADVQKRSW